MLSTNPCSLNTAATTTTSCVCCVRILDPDGDGINCCLSVEPPHGDTCFLRAAPPGISRALLFVGQLPRAFFSDFWLGPAASPPRAGEPAFKSHNAIQSGYGTVRTARRRVHSPRWLCQYSAVTWVTSTRGQHTYSIRTHRLGSYGGGCALNKPDLVGSPRRVHVLSFNVQLAGFHGRVERQ